MTIRIADRWFERRKLDDGISLLWEPHVDPLLRCNIWHVPGRERDLLVDTGMGISSLRDEIRDLIGNPVIALATHAHLDHMGSLHEFDVRCVHPLEVPELEAPGWSSLRVSDWPTEFLTSLEEAGYAIKTEEILSAYPRAGFDVGGFRTPPATATWLVEEGDVIDLGDRSFEVLHLPGHSPGSVALWEQATGTLFSGDTVYDGPLLDKLPGSDIDAYLGSMERLKKLPVSVVHAGHDPSFGRDRLYELADAYLQSRGG